VFLRLREHLNGFSLRSFIACVKCHLGFASEETWHTFVLAGGRKEEESRRANRENRGEFYERRHFSCGKKRNSLPFTLPFRLDAAQKADCQRRKENVVDASEMLLFSRRKREISAASGIAATQVSKTECERS